MLVIQQDVAVWLMSLHHILFNASRLLDNMPRAQATRFQHVKLVSSVSKACAVLLHCGCTNACMGIIDVIEPLLHGTVQVLCWLPKQNDDIDANQGTALILMVGDYNR